MKCTSRSHLGKIIEGSTCETSRATNNVHGNWKVYFRLWFKLNSVLFNAVVYSTDGVNSQLYLQSFALPDVEILDLLMELRSMESHRNSSGIKEHVVKETWYSAGLRWLCSQEYACIVCMKWTHNMDYMSSHQPISWDPLLLSEVNFLYLMFCWPCIVVT
jgi:hypothetical protein